MIEKNIKQIKKIIESEEVLKLDYVKSYTIFKEFNPLLFLKNYMITKIKMNITNLILVLKKTL